MLITYMIVFHVSLLFTLLEYYWTYLITGFGSVSLLLLFCPSIFITSPCTITNICVSILSLLKFKVNVLIFRSYTVANIICYFFHKPFNFELLNHKGYTLNFSYSHRNCNNLAYSIPNYRFKDYLY